MRLRLNPLSRWFAVRTVGYGIGPRTWEGWITILVAVCAIWLFVQWMQPTSHQLRFR